MELGRWLHFACAIYYNHTHNDYARSVQQIIPMWFIQDGQLLHKPADQFVNWQPAYKLAKFAIGLQHI